MYDTDPWPVIQARDYRHYTKGKRQVIWCCIHDAEYPEVEGGARGVARYFQQPDKPSSAHICVDDKEIIQSVMDNDVAYAAGPKGNTYGVHIEVIGYAKQSKEDWLDWYSVAALAFASDATAQYCLKYSLPPVRLTPAQIQAGNKGVCGHVDITNAFGESDHQDPGPNFPWDYFMQSVNNFYKARSR